MSVLKEANRFENSLRQKGSITIKGPVKRKITEAEIMVDASYGIYPNHRTVIGNGVSLVPKDSMIAHYYRIFMDGELLGRYKERYDDGILVKQFYKGEVPDYDFSADGGHGRLRKNVFLLYLPVSDKRYDDFSSIGFP